MSILCIRLGLLTVQKTWEFYEFRSLDHAKQNNSLFYNHHGNYENISCLSRVIESYMNYKNDQYMYFYYDVLSCGKYLILK